MLNGSHASAVKPTPSKGIPNMSSTSDYLKRVSMPKIDDVLAYSGLQRTPSAFSRFLAGAGMISLGCLVGAGLTAIFSSPKNRKQISNALNTGFDTVSSAVSQGYANGKQIVSHGIANGKQAARAAV